ncbi:tripartite tricarboxylate transporter substrate-binding protein [Variovorax rhizosphaerae]|uniref:Tripartite tricarboxylate transporter substrate-binding protein n=1 Tax=Variovorax rhizosphaerae TaxID=1836200 RepID=A0ABU8WZ98_9BURK
MHFPLEIMLVCVRWYAAYPLSLRQLEGDDGRARPASDLTHVVYKGSTPALTDVMGGHVQLKFDGMAISLPMIKSGKIKAFAVGPSVRRYCPMCRILARTSPCSPIRWSRRTATMCAMASLQGLRLCRGDDCRRRVAAPSSQGSVQSRSAACLGPSRARDLEGCAFGMTCAAFRRRH